jgi:hypothetical protein
VEQKMTFLQFFSNSGVKLTPVRSDIERIDITGKVDVHTLKCYHGPAAGNIVKAVEVVDNRGTIATVLALGKDVSSICISLKFSAVHLCIFDNGKSFCQHS